MFLIHAQILLLLSRNYHLAKQLAKLSAKTVSSLKWVKMSRNGFHNLRCNLLSSKSSRFKIFEWTCHFFCSSACGPHGVSMESDKKLAIIVVFHLQILPCSCFMKVCSVYFTLQKDVAGPDQSCFLLCILDSEVETCIAIITQKWSWKNLELMVDLWRIR